MDRNSYEIATSFLLAMTYFIIFPPLSAAGEERDDKRSDVGVSPYRVLFLPSET